MPADHTSERRRIRLPVKRLLQALTSQLTSPTTLAHFLYGLVWDIPRSCMANLHVCAKERAGVNELLTAYSYAPHSYQHVQLLKEQRQAHVQKHRGRHSETLHLWLSIKQNTQKERTGSCGAPASGRPSHLAAHGPR